jgi:hypothetical protein
MKAFLLKLFGEDNGSDVCIAKLMAALAFLAFLAYAIWGLHLGHFAVTEFGTGLMQVLGGSAAIVAGKNITTRTP